MRLWSVASADHLATLQGHIGSVQTVTFSSDGNILASGSNDFTIRLWDVTTGNQLSVFRGHGGYVKSVAFSPDGKTLVSGADDGTVRFWDATGDWARLTNELNERLATVRYMCYMLGYSLMLVPEQLPP